MLSFKNAKYLKSTGRISQNNCFLQFLMVDKKELMKKAPKFDGKKNVWVTDKKNGFIAGEIIGTKGEEVTVQITETKLVCTA